MQLTIMMLEPLQSVLRGAGRQVINLLQQPDCELSEKPVEDMVLTFFLKNCYLYTKYYRRCYPYIAIEYKISLMKQIWG